jgi:hypothetical protein
MNQNGFLFSALLNPLAIPALRLCSIASGLILFFLPLPSLPSAAANTLRSDLTKPLSFITRGRQPSLSFLSSSHIVPTYASLISPASYNSCAAQSGSIPLGLKTALCAGILNRGQSSQSALFPFKRPLLRAADLLTMPPMVPSTKQATGVESSPNLNASISNRVHRLDSPAHRCRQFLQRNLDRIAKKGQLVRHNVHNYAGYRLLFYSYQLRQNETASVQ